MKLLNAIIPIGNFKNDQERLAKWINGFCDPRVHLSFILDSPSDDDWEEAKIFFDSGCKSSYTLARADVKSPGLSRNSGLRTVSSIWTAFWDSDDLPHPNVILRGLSVEDSDVVAFRYMAEDARTGLCKPSPMWGKSKWVNLSIVSTNPGFWRMVFRNEILEQCEFSGIRIGEDLDFLVQVNLESKRIKFDDSIGYQYLRLSTTSLSAMPSSLALLPLLNKQLRTRLMNKSLVNEFNLTILIRSILTTRKYSQENYYVTLKSLIDAILLNPLMSFKIVRCIVVGQIKKMA